MLYYANMITINKMHLSRHKRNIPSCMDIINDTYSIHLHFIPIHDAIHNAESINLSFAGSAVLFTFPRIYHTPK